jgi:hypothetical protein
MRRQKQTVVRSYETFRYTRKKEKEEEDVQRLNRNIKKEEWV